MFLADQIDKETNQHTGTRKGLLWKIFLAALTIRWTYDLVLFFAMGEAE